MARVTIWVSYPADYSTRDVETLRSAAARHDGKFDGVVLESFPAISLVEFDDQHGAEAFLTELVSRPGWDAERSVIPPSGQR